MTTYFDTSAVVKLLVQEEDSAQARGLWDGASAAVTSRLAYPESRAALAAARGGGRLTKGSLDAAKRILDRVWAQVHVVELTSENTDQVVVKVTNGTLLLFPAYLPHSVDANASEGERVTNVRRTPLSHMSNARYSRCGSTSRSLSGS